MTSGTVEISATGMDSMSSWLNAAQLDGKIADLPGINVSFADLDRGITQST